MNLQLKWTFGKVCKQVKVRGDRNAKIRGNMVLKQIIREIKKRQLLWFRNLCRIKDSRSPKIALQWELEGRR